ncbi:hypothetical protein G6O67_006776 [Ophiocordyceps sinensis]|nr:hypothetical protein G6O67_006776 [Ophiocordyceps sinensis]
MAVLCFEAQTADAASDTRLAFLLGLPSRNEWWPAGGHSRDDSLAPIRGSPATALRGQSDTFTYGFTAESPGCCCPQGKATLSTRLVSRQLEPGGDARPLAPAEAYTEARTCLSGVTLTSWTNTMLRRLTTVETRRGPFVLATAPRTFYH